MYRPLTFQPVMIYKEHTRQSSIWKEQACLSCWHFYGSVLYSWITSLTVKECQSFPSPASPENRADVWRSLPHRGVVRMSLRPHRSAGRSLQFFPAHQSLLRLSQSWTHPVQWTLHVDPLLQWWRAGGDWLPGPVQLYCRWLKCSVVDVPFSHCSKNK